MLYTLVKSSEKFDLLQLVRKYFKKARVQKYNIYFETNPDLFPILKYECEKSHSSRPPSPSSQWSWGQVIRLRGNMDSPMDHTPDSFLPPLSRRLSVVKISHLHCIYFGVEKYFCIIMCWKLKRQEKHWKTQLSIFSRILHFRNTKTFAIASICQIQ